MRSSPLALAALFALAAPAALAQTIINSVPYTISVSGQYKLGNNLVTAATSQTAITIAAPNVILDLDGFFVSGPGNGYTPQLPVISVANVSNVTIRNGTVANNGYGILFRSGANSINHLVERVNVTRCPDTGIYFEGNSSSSLLRRCTISQISGGFGTFAAGVLCADGVRVENCFISSVFGNSGSAGGFGILMGSSSFAFGNTVTNCQFAVSGGKYQNNLTANSANPIGGGIDAGGNN